MALSPNDVAQSAVAQSARLRAGKPAACSTSFIILALALVACVGIRPTWPADETAGQREAAILPEFRPFYEQHGGAAILGYPVSGRCHNNEEHLVQFFQNFRLEYDAGRPPEQQVVLYPLGEWALAGERELAPANESSLSPTRYFSQTQQALHGAFRAFYEANQGERLLGPPISPLLDEGPLRVQYFRNGRLEWRPDEPIEFRVRLGPLGAANYLHRQAAGVTCDVTAQPVIPGPVKLLVAVREPILFMGEKQVVYVTAVSPEGRPKPGLSVVVSLDVDDAGASQRLALQQPVPLGVTGDDGRLQGVIDLKDYAPGQQVVLRVAVNTAGVQLINDASLVFRTWW
ncbi:MAG: hypothetical protein AB1791_10825 [Chloroflexota bacterium]